MVLFIALILFSCDIAENISVETTYSNGYRAGKLIKWSAPGTVGLFKTGEGELLLGKGSTIQYNDSLDVINPWSFSSNRDTSFYRYIGKDIILKYSEEYYTGVSRTPYIVNYDDVELITYEYPEYFKIHNVFSVNASDGNYSKGQRWGRFVKISRKGNIIKTWETTIQVGGDNGVLFHMSVRNNAMAERIIECIKSGMNYRIYYTQDNIELEYSTSYDIYKISK